MRLRSRFAGLPLMMDGEAGRPLDSDFAPQPTVHVRTFVVPPGAPWTQARAAALEVQHGAPLPLSQLVHRLKRRDGWRPGQSARFTAFYVKRSDYRTPFETTVDVDGEMVRVAFGARRTDLGRWRGLLGVAIAASVALATVAWGVTDALSVRAEVSGRLETLERQAAARLRQGRQVEEQFQTEQALAHAQGRAGTVEDLLNDLTWVSHARAGASQVLAVHWDHGLIVLESRGAGPPVAAGDRDIIRAPRMLRPGVSLWGVRRRTGAVVAGGSGTVTQ